jgi:uncharacterized membrane protein
VSFELKSQWVYGVAVLMTTLAYVGWLSVQLADRPARDVAYVGPLLWTIGASVVVNALGRAAVQAQRGQDDFADERDREVGRRADALTFPVFSVLAAVPFGLGLLEVDAFWITNGLFAAFALAALFGVAARSVLYRRGV